MSGLYQMMTPPRLPSGPLLPIKGEMRQGQRKVHVEGNDLLLDSQAQQMFKKNVNFLLHKMSEHLSTARFNE